MGPRTLPQPESRDRTLTVLALRSSEEVRRRTRFAIPRRPSPAQTEVQTNDRSQIMTPTCPHRFQLSDATVTGTLRIPALNKQTRSKPRSPSNAANPEGPTTTESANCLEVTKPQSINVTRVSVVITPCSSGTGIPISCGPTKNHFPDRKSVV